MLETCSILYVPQQYTAVSFNKCTDCKSLWIKEPAKCPKCKCKRPSPVSHVCSPVPSAAVPYLGLVGARLLGAVHGPGQPLQLLHSVLAGLNVGLHHTLRYALCRRTHQHTKTLC